MGCVYLITNKVNGKIYVGKTIKVLHARWNDHIIGSRRKGKGKILLVQKAIRKYGPENFSIITLLESDDDNILSIKEREFIKKFDSRNLSIGYNLHEGGRGGDTGVRSIWSEERRKQARNRRLGKALPMETRLKVSATKKKKRILCARGHELTPENTYSNNGRRKCKICASIRYKGKKETIEQQRLDGINLPMLRGWINPSVAMRVSDRPKRPHCSKGHAMTFENTYITVKGYYVCKECRYAHSHNAWLKRKLEAA